MPAAKKTKRGRSQDRKRVAAGQAHEVKYEAKKTSATPSEVKTTVKNVSTWRSKIESALGKLKRKRTSKSK